MANYFNGLKFKPVFRHDPTMKIFRLFRVIWRRGRGAGLGGSGNYHGVFKVALSRRMFGFSRLPNDMVVTVVWIRFTYEKSYGGIPV